MVVRRGDRPDDGLRAFVASALIGAATGGRTFTGLAALTLTAPPAPTAQPDRTLAATATRAGVGFAAVQELVLDKLPRAPSRLEPPALLARVAVAAISGVVVARRTGAAPARRGDPAPGATSSCALIASAAALGTSWLGVRWRGWAATRLGADWVGAAIEDVAVVTLAAMVARTIS